jgi:hypothetical protein
MSLHVNILKFDVCETTTSSDAKTMNNGLEAIDMNLKDIDNDLMEFDT